MIIKKYNTQKRKNIPKYLKYEVSKLMYQYRYKQGMTLDRIGKMFGRSRERVRQIIQVFEAELNDREKNLTNKKKENILKG